MPPEFKNDNKNHQSLLLSPQTLCSPLPPYANPNLQAAVLDQNLINKMTRNKSLGFGCVASIHEKIAKCADTLSKRHLVRWGPFGAGNLKTFPSTRFARASRDKMLEIFARGREIGRSAIALRLIFTHFLTTFQSKMAPANRRDINRFWLLLMSNLSRIERKKSCVFVCVYVRARACVNYEN